MGGIPSPVPPMLRSSSSPDRFSISVVMATLPRRLIGPCRRYTMTVVVPCATSLPCESTTLPSAVATRRPGCNTVPVATKRSPSTGTVRT
ncbi:Uncharacterised protein [Mycobacteroides abscessus subsp. abscessus]|nr:Uncharacterised protein [Mycobacteroides abscessus subsp. abscessus]